MAGGRAGGPRALSSVLPASTILAAYDLVMSDLTDHRGPIAVLFPVNLRQHRGEQPAANVGITLERAPGEGDGAILPRVVEATAALEAVRIGIAEQAGMDASSDPEGRRIQEMAEEMAALLESGLADIFISNPGPIALPGIEELSDASLCYPGGRMPGTCFGISTFHGRMTITSGYQDSERSREGTRTPMQLFRRHLLSFANA